jgi:hypothetical protein
MVITPQAKIAAIGYILVWIAMIVTLLISPFVKDVTSWVRVLFYIVISVISVYALNCTIVGSCHLYAWIVGYVMVIMGILVILSLLFNLAKN